MRNLLLMKTFVFDLKGDSPGSLEHLLVDALSRVIFVANDNVVLGFDPESNKILHKLMFAEHGYMSDGEQQKVVSLASDDDAGEVCIAMSAGDLIVWNATNDRVEQVGTVEQGIIAMEWSPDQDVFVLVTGADTLILMTREFDPILEIPIHTDDFGGDLPVNIGWGKKETQFHGSQGKPQEEELKAKERGNVLSSDDRISRISWRGDGQYFAINAVEQRSGTRKIRVWSREGVLQSTNEAMTGLEQALDWRPSGNLIASSQRKPHKYDIIFFEKNGLCHGEFSLPFATAETKVIELKWNRDSDVLAVWLEGAAALGKGETSSCVQLWTTSNYHWYLKQEMHYDSSNGSRVTAMRWDPETSLKLHITCQDGCYYQYVWTYAIHASRGNASENLSTVAVIDGDKLLLSPFKSMVVPPPMCGTTVTFPSPILQVAFGPSGVRCSDIAVILSDGSVSFYAKGISVQPIESRFDEQRNMHGCRHLSWIDDDRLVAVTENNEIIEMSIDFGSDHAIIKTRDITSFDGDIVRVCSGVCDAHLIIQDAIGKIFKYSSANSDDTPILSPFLTTNGEQLKLASVCTTIAAVRSETKEFIVGLTDFFGLFINNVKLASNCTSFAVHEDFLLLTTHQHTCRCVSLASLEDVAPLPDTNDVQDESIRRIERGGRIISAVVNDTKVILQMPRGNLETIHPRTLIISKLKHLFDRLEYGDAFAIMRKHRINTNLMMDHNPKLFLENVEAFVRGARSADDINLFLADLKSEDVSTTLYAPFYVNSKESREPLPSKVDQACQALRDALTTVDPDRFLHSILTTHARQTPPDLETVLVKIKKLRDSHSSTSNGGKHTVADKALKYILYLIDVSSLYDVALGMYDFNIVIMVAAFSHKDPKEYLPFLNHLKTLEPNYQRYTIDCHLKRYSKALQHIVECGDEKFGECLSFIEEHRLHGQALKLYKESTEQHKAISKSYGRCLMAKKMYNEAGLVFWRCCCYHDALEAFCAGTNWSAAMCQAVLLGFNEKETIDLANKLVEKLVESRRYVDAAYLQEHYLKDIERAAVTLIEGRKWQEVIFLLHKHNRRDVIETNLKPALVEENHRLVTSIEDAHAHFTKHEARLRLVREQKQADLLNYQDGDDFHAADGMYSEASSVTGMSATSYGSRSSRSSGHSSKSRRKVQRKKYSLKEGSKNEEFALTEALAQLTNTCHEQQNEVGSLLSVLMLFAYDDKCAQLQDSFHGYVTTVEQGQRRVWSPSDAAMSNQIVTGPQTSVNELIAQFHQLKTNEPAENDLPPPTQPNFKPQQWQLRRFETTPK